MGKRYLIDSNILIGFSGTIIDDEFNISVINKIEVLGHPSAEGNLKRFINSANILDLDTETTERTIKLRIKHSIKMPDSIIAATALEYRLIVFSAQKCVGEHGCRIGMAHYKNMLTFMLFIPFFCQCRRITVIIIYDFKIIFFAVARAVSVVRINGVE